MRPSLPERAGSVKGVGQGSPSQAGPLLLGWRESYCLAVTEEVVDVAAPPSAAEPEPEVWKLKKETTPPGLLGFEDFVKTIRYQYMPPQHGMAYMSYLFDREAGLYGNRPGNPWRMSRRKWIEHFVSIQDKQTGNIVPFRLNEAQRAVEAAVVRAERRGEPVRVSILKARQQGISTLITAHLLYLSITSCNTRGMLMGHLKNSAGILQGRMRDMLRLLRKKGGGYWQILIETKNVNELTLALPQHSTVLVWTAEGADYRGDTLRFFHAIEPAEWPSAKAKQKANAVWKSVPKAAHTYVFVEGTARGDTGWFAETWKAAWKRQRYGSESLYDWTQALFFPWYIHDRYRWTVVFGRELPKAHEEEIMATLSEEEHKLLRQKYLRRGKGWVCVDIDQLAWRRMAIVEDCQGMVEFFHQEYPSYPEEAFLSTGLKFFSAKAIADMREASAGAPIWKGDTVDQPGERRMMQTLADLERAS